MNLRYITEKWIGVKSGLECDAKKEKDIIKKKMFEQSSATISLFIKDLEKLNGEDLKRDKKSFCNCGNIHCYVDEMKLYCSKCQKLVNVASIT